MGVRRRSPEETHSRGSWCSARRSGSPLICAIKRHGCESDRNCGRRGVRFADGSRWGTADSGTAGGGCSSLRGLPAGVARPGWSVACSTFGRFTAGARVLCPGRAGFGRPTQARSPWGQHPPRCHSYSPRNRVISRKTGPAKSIYLPSPAVTEAIRTRVRSGRLVACDIDADHFKATERSLPDLAHRVS